MRMMKTRAAARLLAGGLALAAFGGGSALADPPGDLSTWRKVDPENLLLLTIKRQDVLIELRPDFAPAHVEQIRKVTRDGNYNALPFHRVIDDFMAQGGEVTAVYMLSKPYPMLKAEFTFRRKPADVPVKWVGDTGTYGYLDGFIVTGQPDAAAAMQKDGAARAWALHCAGVTSMARTNDPNSADTQFFLMRQSRDALDAQYTVWGRALTGLEVIRSIKAGPEETDGRLSPGAADKLTKATIVADMPAPKRLSVWVKRTESAEFAASLAGATAANAAEACNLPAAPVHVEIPTNE